MSTKRIGLLLGILLIGVGQAQSADRDAKADAIGKEMIAALGGTGAWDKARQLQFTFVVDREGKTVARFSHVWDRYTGDYVVTGTDKTGAPFAVYFNVNSKQGKALVNGKPAEGDELEKLLQSGYGRFINDTYWLLAPWKIFDPGVHLTYDGEKPCPEGGTCDILKLSFDEVGMTPKDVYWMWVTRDGRHMVQWQYVLNGAQEEPTSALWKNWRSFSGMSLSLDKPITGKPVVIRFENVAVSAARDDSLFKAPTNP